MHVWSKSSAWWRITSHALDVTRHHTVQVVFHVKQLPWFVSDTRIADVDWLLVQLRTSGVWRDVCVCVAGGGEAGVVCRLGRVAGTERKMLIWVVSCGVQRRRPLWKSVWP